VIGTHGICCPKAAPKAHVICAAQLHNKSGGEFG
jgi:hypothetical protein